MGVNEQREKIKKLSQDVEDLEKFLKKNKTKHNLAMRQIKKEIDHLEQDRQEMMRIAYLKSEQIEELEAYLNESSKYKEMTWVLPVSISAGLLLFIFLVAYCKA